MILPRHKVSRLSVQMHPRLVSLGYHCYLYPGRHATCQNVLNAAKRKHCWAVT